MDARSRSNVTGLAPPQPAVRASYGANYERLSQLKKKYDPENFFRSNQNIAPAS
jgi:FAD/FMN-containing dehydrogenase